MIAIKTSERYITTWDIISAVLDVLLAQCNTSPHSSHIGEPYRGQSHQSAHEARTQPPGMNYARRALLNLQSNSQINSPDLSSHG